MQLVALKYFVAVADHGSFTAAAEWLGVSASTLTRSVSTLEDNLGLTLFERSSRGVALAPAAAPVLAETKRMLAGLEAVTEAAGSAARGLAGELRLGVRSPPLGEPLRSMLARWRRDHPDVRLIVHELPDLELFTELVARRIDVALIPRAKAADMSEIPQVLDSRGRTLRDRLALAGCRPPSLGPIEERRACAR